MATGEHIEHNHSLINTYVSSMKAMAVAYKKDRNTSDMKMVKYRQLSMVIKDVTLSVMPAKQAAMMDVTAAKDFRLPVMPRSEGAIVGH